MPGWVTPPTFSAMTLCPSTSLNELSQDLNYLSTPPLVRVGMGATQTITAGAGNTVVQCNTVTYDTQSGWAGSGGSPAYAYTIQVTGYYDISLAALVNVLSGTPTWQLQLLVNGTLIEYQQQGGGNASATWGDCLHFTSGQYVQLGLLATGSNIATTSSGNTWMALRWRSF